MGSYSQSLSSRLTMRGVHHKSASRYNNLGTSVARVTNKLIFDIDTPPTGIDKLDLFVCIPRPYASVTSRYTTTDAAYDVKKHIKEKGYHLLVDDRRMLADIHGFDENTNVLVVARNVEKAKKAVETLGIPKHLYLDYHLQGYDYYVKYEDSTLPFIDWLDTFIGEDKCIIDIPSSIVSEHEQKWKIQKQMRDLTVKKTEK